MKKIFLIGMATMVSFQMSVANAAGVIEVRRSVVEDNKHALDKGAINGVSEISIQAAKNDISNLLVGVARNADTKEMSAVLDREITVNGKKIALLDEGRKILSAKQSLDKLNRNSLDEQGQKHYDTLREALEIKAQFLTLEAKSSSIRLNLDKQTQAEVDAFHKELSLDLLTMDTKELQSHIDMMKAAVAAKVSPAMTGDQAFAAALKAKYGNDYLKKLEEIIGCREG